MSTFMCVWLHGYLTAWKLLTWHNVLSMHVWLWAVNLFISLFISLSSFKPGYKSVFKEWWPPQDNWVSASTYISLKETTPFFEVWVGFLVLKARLDLIIVTHGCVSSPWEISDTQRGTRFLPSTVFRKSFSSFSSSLDKTKNKAKQ